jgi:integrase
MAYAEKVPSPAGTYWRGRFKDPEGRYVSVRDEHGDVIRYPRKADAKKAADGQETDVGRGVWRDPAAGGIAFAEWAGEWHAALDLAPSTMENLTRHLEDHLLPAFGAMPLRDIDAAAIARWERDERKAVPRYAESSIRTWRGTLHTVLEDATGRHIASNPAARKRGRGKRAGRKQAGGPEKVITTPLGALLIAERMAILSGRDDEFVMTVTAFWEALRLGELTGLEKPYVRPGSLRVEWQLHEVRGELLRVPPKDESYGDPLLPPFLRSLLAAHVARTRPAECPCHGKAYVFRGMGVPRGLRGNMPLRELAELAGVSETVVATVLGGKGRVGEGTRRHVEKAIRAGGYEASAAPDGPAWHWRRSSFEGLFTAAASGQLPPRAPMPRRPVLLRGQWPGERVHGRNAEARAELCWVPVAEGLTPHGLRHSVKTWMEEKGIPEIMSETHLRHDIPGISGAYRHVTPAMRRDLSAAMAGGWEEALGERLAMSPSSPVAVLARLLEERAEARKLRRVPRDSPGGAEGVLPFPASTPSDLRRGDRI